MATKQRRTKGEGSITQLPNKKFKVVYTLPLGLDGKQKRKCATVNTKKEAIDKIAEFNVKYKNKDELKKLSDEHITFSEYIEKWLRQYKVAVAETTYRSNKSLIDARILPTFGAVRMSNINTEDINEFLMGLLEDNLKPSSILKIRTLLSSIFESADTIITKNPVRKSMKLPKASKKADLPLPTELQIKEALKVAKERQGDENFYKYLYPMLLLLVSTGMRRGEVTGLKWERIDFKRSIIEVRSQITRAGIDVPLKTTNAIRDIIVTPEVLGVINQIPRISEYVFTGNNRKHLSTDYVSIFMKRFFKHMKFPQNCTVHDLRHYHATTLLKNKMYVNAVSKRLGHSDVKVTLSIYGHYLPSMDEEALKIIGADYVV